ncbi:MAG: hypothetical protein AB3N20_09885 [Rhizobiaceae bacterium]
MSISRIFLLTVATWLAVVTITVLAAALTPVAPPQLYFDQGWKKLFEANGDLNHDGFEDRAIIMEAPDQATEPPAGCDGEDDYSDAPVRRLLVLFADSQSGEDLAVDEPQLVFRADQGGVMGDPLVELRIERGAIVIENFGGSRHRWADTMRFRFDNDEWRLIGWTQSTIDSLSASVVTYDYNPLTEKMLRTVDFPEDEEIGSRDPFCIACQLTEACPEMKGCYAGTKPAIVGERWFEIGPRDNILMAGFLCWRDRVGLLRHLGFEDGR